MVTTASIRRQLRPFCVCVLFVTCRAVAALVAAIHCLSVRCRLADVSSLVSSAPHGRNRTIRDIWFARLARESLALVLSTSLRQAALDRVTCVLPPNQDSGCVIAIFHTPWDRLLAFWCCDSDIALVVAGKIWVRRAGQGVVPGGVQGVRRLIRHLRAGGHVVVMADYPRARRGCTARFLGQEWHASILPARLAACAGVPLLAWNPSFDRGRLHLEPGPAFAVGSLPEEQEAVTRSVLTYFERTIREKPALWSHSLRVRTAS